MTEQEQWLADQKQKHEAEINSLPLAKKRYSICKQCEHYISLLLLCKECNCFLPGKTRITDTACPLEKW